MASPLHQSVETGTDVSSHAAIGGHPIHPLLVPIAIGMYVAAVCADVAFARTGDTFWARAGFCSELWWRG